MTFPLFSFLDRTDASTAGSGAPQITAASPPDGTVGVAYSYAFQATGAAPITWSVFSGALPAGVTLNATTGVISGTPTTAAVYTFTIRATNALGNATTASIGVTVAAAWTPASLAGRTWGFDARVGVTDAGAGAVSALADQQDGFNVSQAVGGNRPVTGAATINGHNIIRFTGAQFLARASVPRSQPFAVYGVVAFRSLTGYEAPFDLGQSPTPGPQLVTDDANADHLSIYAGSLLDSGFVPVIGTAYAFIAIFNGASSEVYVNATHEGGTLSPGSLNAIDLRLGGTVDGALADIDLAEIHLANVPSIETRALFFGYAHTTWGTADNTSGGGGGGGGPEGAQSRPWVGVTDLDNLLSDATVNGGIDIHVPIANSQAGYVNSLSNELGAAVPGWQISDWTAAKAVGKINLAPYIASLITPLPTTAGELASRLADWDVLIAAGESAGVNGYGCDGEPYGYPGGGDDPATDPWNLADATRMYDYGHGIGTRVAATSGNKTFIIYMSSHQGWVGSNYDEIQTQNGNPNSYTINKFKNFVHGLIDGGAIVTLSDASFHIGKQNTIPSTMAQAIARCVTLTVAEFGAGCFASPMFWPDNDEAHGPFSTGEMQSDFQAAVHNATGTTLVYQHSLCGGHNVAFWWPAAMLAAISDGINS